MRVFVTEQAGERTRGSVKDMPGSLGSGTSTMCAVGASLLRQAQG